MERQEALEQVEYMKRLIEDTSFRVSVGYPIFLMWGVIWVIGYIGGVVAPEAVKPWVWPVLLVAAFVGHAIDARSHRYRVNPPTALTRRMFRINVLLAAATFLLPAVLGLEGAVMGATSADQTQLAFSIGFGPFYIPFMVGLIYVVNGIFLGAEFVRIGTWLMVSSVTATIVGVTAGASAAFVWMAVTGGGSLLLTGILLRNSWLSERSAVATGTA
ncbi:MAG: hypothetical protein KY429_09820 [Actinobacteria bacterium]|nr:hypothetical protein [Actinomycetota bacterium]